MTLKLKLQLAISVAVLVTAGVLAGYAVGNIRSQAAADVARIRAEKTAQVKQDLADLSWRNRVSHLFQGQVLARPCGWSC